MLDAQQLAQMVEQEIREEVHAQVQQAVSQTEWLSDLEKRIIEFVQHRIIIKFDNIETFPDLVETVKGSVNKLFAQGELPGIDTYVDQAQIKQSVDTAVEELVNETLANLTVDPAWLSKIEKLVLERAEDRIRSKMRDIDLSARVSQVIMENQDVILDALAQDFESTGIKDHATQTQLTVLDGAVVIEQELVAHDLSVERNTTLKGDVLIQGDLGIQGRINTDNQTWRELSEHVGNVTYDRVKQDFAQELINQVIAKSKEGIEVDNITVDGSPLLSGDTLSPGLKKSSLTRVGRLESLAVDGTAKIAGTLTAVRGRVGVNTEDPEDALSIWDEEVSIVAGKRSKDTGFLGTARRQNLVIGTNKQNHIEIDAEGQTTIQKLRIGRNNISWGTDVPGYSGTKGDIVFNINVTPDTPFAWICLGAFRWQPLKAM